MIERNHHLVVASSELMEGSCLLLEKGNKRLERSACLELDGEWMFDEVCPCLVFVFLASSLKKCLEDSVFRRGIHTETRWRGGAAGTGRVSTEVVSDSRLYSQFLSAVKHSAFSVC